MGLGPTFCSCFLLLDVISQENTASGAAKRRAWGLSAGPKAIPSDGRISHGRLTHTHTHTHTHTLKTLVNCHSLRPR